MREVLVFIPILQMGKGRKNKAKEKVEIFKKYFYIKALMGSKSWDIDKHIVGAH